MEISLSIFCEPKCAAVHGTFTRIFGILDWRGSVAKRVVSGHPRAGNSPPPRLLSLDVAHGVPCGRAASVEEFSVDGRPAGRRECHFYGEPWTDGNPVERRMRTLCSLVFIMIRSHCDREIRRPAVYGYNVIISGARHLHRTRRKWRRFAITRQRASSMFTRRDIVLWQSQAWAWGVLSPSKTEVNPHTLSNET